MATLPFLDCFYIIDNLLSDPVHQNYRQILYDLTEKWLNLEIHHHKTSKSGSEDFWNLAKDFFPKLARARINEMVYKPIPKLKYQRKKMYKDNVPPIEMDFGYENKETCELTTFKSDKTPLKRFNPRQYQKVFEVATVKVILYVTSIIIPTSPFTILVPHDQEIGEFYVVQERRATDFEAPKL